MKLDSSKIELIDIQIPSIKNVSLQLAWGEQHAQKLISQYTTPSAKIIAKEQTKIAGPFRFNFLSKLGNNLYSPYSSSVKSLFGDYILILDNFSVDHMFQKGLRNDSKDAKRAGLTDKSISQRNEIYEATRNKDQIARSDFSQIIKRLAATFPATNFIMRPHPLLSSIFWHQEFADIRNVHIIGYGSVNHWIYGAMCTIHSGCTTGLEAIASNIPSFDITSLISPRGVDITKSFVGYSNSRITSQDTLIKSIHKLLFSKAKPTRPDLQERFQNLPLIFPH